MGQQLRTRGARALYTVRPLHVVMQYRLRLCEVYVYRISTQSLDRTRPNSRRSRQPAAASATGTGSRGAAGRATGHRRTAHVTGSRREQAKKTRSRIVRIVDSFSRLSSINKMILYFAPRFMAALL